MADVQSIPDATKEWAAQRGVEFHFSRETGSTNDDAKSHALNEPDEFTLYLATHQTKGRGRGANHWLDTGAGENLLSTWSVALDQPAQAITGPRIGLALFLAAQATWPSCKWALKAPNDLLLKGAKTAGLLVETISDGSAHRLLVGLGLNVLNHPRSLPDATHIAESLDAPMNESDWYRFLDQWVKELRAAVTECQSAQLVPTVRAKLVTALNANPRRPFVVEDVTATGDLVYKGGVVRWTEI